MSVCVALSQMVMELSYIQPDVGAGVKADSLTIDLQPIVNEGFSEGIERTPEGGPAATPIGFRPEQVDQRVAPMAFSRYGYVGQQGNGFARIHADRLTVALDSRRAQEVQT
jgi:hypothetical protein